MKVINNGVYLEMSKIMRDIQLHELLDTLDSRIKKVLLWNKLNSYIKSVCSLDNTNSLETLRSVIEDLDLRNIPF